MSENFHNPDLPDLSDSQAVLDTNMFISMRNQVARFLRAIGNPKIYHTKIIFGELLDIFMRYGMDEEEAFQQIHELFRAFNSTMLPKVRKTRKIARKISKNLKLAGLQRHKVKDEKNDTIIAALAMIYGIDVVSRDALFYVIGKIFTTGINFHLVYEKRPDAWAKQMKTILKKKGIKTPIDLTHLLDKIRKRHLPQRKAKMPKEAEEK